MPAHRIPLETRFWRRVQRGDGCWKWTGSFFRGSGYGQISVDSGRGNRSAHRVSYELNVGPIPDGMQVCHRCDNRWCVRPDHLFLGTHQDNMDDRSAKGRQSRGVHRPAAKLRAVDVMKIRRRVAAGETQQSVADAFGVSQSAISHITAGRNWRHVA